MPTRKLNSSDVTEHLADRLREAEEIWLVDARPDSGPDGRHPWMELIVSGPPPVPETVDPAATQSDPVILEVEVDSQNLDEVLALRERIRQLRGTPPSALPPA